MNHQELANSLHPSSLVFLFIPVMSSLTYITHVYRLPGVSSLNHLDSRLHYLDNHLTICPKHSLKHSSSGHPELCFISQNISSFFGNKTCAPIELIKSEKRSLKVDALKFYVIESPSNFA